MAQATTQQRHRRLARVASILAGLGLVVALYLTWLDLRGGPSAPGALLCGPGSGCATVWASPYARLAGIPVAALGAAAYLVLLALGLWGGRVAASVPARGGERRRGARTPRPRLPWQLTAATGLAWAGAIFSIYLAGVQVLVLRTLCPWCTVSALIMVALAIVHTLALPVRLPGGPAAAGVVGGIVLAVVHYVPAAGTGPSGTLPPASWAGGVQLAPVSSLMELERLMSAGDEDAAVHVEIYSDFQCPYCAQAAALVIAPLLDEDVANGRMRITFHNFAFLGQESQWAAEAAACAAVQGQFWPYHDRLFASALGENVGSFTFARLTQLARQTGLDEAAFQRCLEGRQMQRLVEESRRQGSARGVRATPTFFVNGRRIEGLVPVSEIRRVAYVQ